LEADDAAGAVGVELAADGDAGDADAEGSVVTDGRASVVVGEGLQGEGAVAGGLDWFGVGGAGEGVDGLPEGRFLEIEGDVRRVLAEAAGDADARLALQLLEGVGERHFATIGDDGVDDGG